MKLTAKIIVGLTVVLVVVVSVLVLSRNATFYYERASVKMAKGNFAGALADYTKVIKLKPDYVGAYIGRGGAEYKQGDPRSALFDYYKAIQLQPDLRPIPEMGRTDEKTVTNEIATQVLTLFKAKAYDQMDELAAKLRSTKERYADGVWKLSCVYDGLIPSNRSSDQEWETRLTDIGSWATAKPDSITARVARANVLVAYAWKARSSGWSGTVSPEGWRLFGRRLAEAVKVLSEAKTLKEQCPQFWRVLMTAALGLQADKTQFNEIFAEAIKFEPDYVSYYFRRLVYLLPRWYGSKGEWESDLARSADMIGGEKGDMLYAQVIWNMSQFYPDENPFLEGDISWTRIDKGFEVIEKTFPDSLGAKIGRSQFAILLMDAKAATSLR